MFSQLKERGTQIEQGLYPPLIFNAEGGTSNGRQILKFKKGAFVNLNSVQPKVIKYSSYLIEIENSVIDLGAHAILISCCPYSTLKIIELPVFKPNDYFFENHQ